MSNLNKPDQKTSKWQERNEGAWSSRAAVTRMVCLLIFWWGGGGGEASRGNRRQSFAVLMSNSAFFHSPDLGGQSGLVADTGKLYCLAGCLMGNWQSYFFSRFGLSLGLHYMPLSFDAFGQH